MLFDSFERAMECISGRNFFGFPPGKHGNPCFYRTRHATRYCYFISWRWRVTDFTGHVIAIQDGGLNSRHAIYAQNGGSVLFEWRVRFRWRAR